MPTRHDHPGMNAAAALAAALRTLPTAAPPQDAWAQLAARTQRRRRWRHAAHVALPAALAAGIVIAVLMPRAQHPVATSAPQQASARSATSTRSAAPADLAALAANSRAWQAWVATLNRDGAPLNGSALNEAVRLHDRIGLVDLQLSAARKPATTADLWLRRIALLQRLGQLHLEPYATAPAARTAPTVTAI